ncbi:MAG: glycosyltransferase [Gammaproteobacteria bacterium]|nr:glycosyltransferase [Gammaproteobacteria bacterium]
MSRDFPKISVVTPSFNQSEFLERTIKSVLDQGYPNLEYIIIDGGSTDGSVDIIRKYQSQLAYWVSESDNGQSHAINKGLRRATGDWVAWQNSDDIYYPGVFSNLAHVAGKNPGTKLIVGNMMLIDPNDRILRDIRYVRPSHKAMLVEGMLLANQATFWHRDVHQEIGWMDEDLHFSFDYEWFLRLTKCYEGVHVNRFWGALRLHGEAKLCKWPEKSALEHTTVRLCYGPELPLWEAGLYRAYRLAQLVANGEMRYVIRGILRRLKGKQGYDSY